MLVPMRFASGHCRGDCGSHSGPYRPTGSARCGGGRLVRRRGSPSLPAAGCPWRSLPSGCRRTSAPLVAGTAAGCGRVRTPWWAAAC